MWRSLQQPWKGAVQTVLPVPHNQLRDVHLLHRQDQVWRPRHQTTTVQAKGSFPAPHRIQELQGKGVRANESREVVDSGGHPAGSYAIVIFPSPRDQKAAHPDPRGSVPEGREEEAADEFGGKGGSGGGEGCAKSIDGELPKGKRGQI